MRVGHRQVSFKRARLTGGPFFFPPAADLLRSDPQHSLFAHGASFRQVLIKETPSRKRRGFFI